MVRMGILSRKRILEEIKKGAIVVAPPLSEEDITQGSFDLRLGNEFGQIRSTPYLVDLSETVIDSSADCLPEVAWIREDAYYLLPPESSIVAKTVQSVKLPEYLCGWVTGRGRFVVLGLNIHIATGFVQPGSEGQLFFLVTNISSSYVKLVPGTKICQLVLQEVYG